MWPCVPAASAVPVSRQIFAIFGPTPTRARSGATQNPAGQGWVTSMLGWGHCDSGARRRVRAQASALIKVANLPPQVGIMAAAWRESETGETVLHQLNHVSLGTCLVLAVWVYASLAPILKGVKQEAFGERSWPGESGGCWAGPGLPCSSSPEAAWNAASNQAHSPRDTSGPRTACGVLAFKDLLRTPWNGRDVAPTHRDTCWTTVARATAPKAGQDQRSRLDRISIASSPHQSERRRVKQLPACPSLNLSGTSASANANVGA